MLKLELDPEMQHRAEKQLPLLLILSNGSLRNTLQ